MVAEVGPYGPSAQQPRARHRREGPALEPEACAKCLQSSRLNICYYHQDLHPWRLHPDSRPRLQCSPRRPSYSSAHVAPGIVHHLSGPNVYALAPPHRRCGRDGPVVRPTRDGAGILPDAPREGGLHFHCASELSVTP
ncbi:hypothetical protein NP493_4067g00007 [Ridgeia piscesae]|uniref:Uncharacterized protein n=1 Tax=Ridgeia piscesae TaxID=27915 RepID=A0AAD9MT32_RIDPI|nr:hypothetical protein NP493_4067g00007 [Ridgeia piscesae]